jgi:hypothetical protein
MALAFPACLFPFRHCEPFPFPSLRAAGEAIQDKDGLLRRDASRKDRGGRYCEPQAKQSRYFKRGCCVNCVSS